LETPPSWGRFHFTGCIVEITLLDYALAMLRIILLFLLCTSPLLAAESGYRIVHPDGTVEFTDQPVKGAEPITLPDVPTYSMPASGGQGNAATPATEPKKDQAVSRTITVNRPAREETVRFDENGMSVAVSVNPPLASGEQVIIRLDGSEVARGPTTSFTLQDVYRGTHVLSAALIDNNDAVMSESSPITFFMRQHSTK